MVDGPDGLVGAVAGYNHGDITLRGTLGGGAYGDAVVSQGGQHLAGSPAVPQDVVADDANDGKASLHPQRIQLPQGNLIGEAGIGRTAGFFGVTVLTDVHTPRFCGEFTSVATLRIEFIPFPSAGAVDFFTELCLP